MSSFRKSTQNGRKPPFFDAKRIGLVQNVLAGSMTLSRIILSIFVIANCPAAGLAQYGALCTRRTLLLISSVPYIAVLLQVGHKYHTSVSPFRSFISSGRCFSDLSAVVTASRKSMLRRVSLFYWTVSCSPISYNQSGAV